VSKRLQVVMGNEELEILRAAAAASHQTLSEWVRAELRHAARRRSDIDAGHRIDVIRRAAGHAFPAPDIEQMLEEIESGYSSSA
jgi:hypothetical protein